VVLCAGAPDTPEIGKEMSEGVATASQQRGGVIWIQQMLPRHEVIQFYSHASVFCCPSVYEPFGIINLEAMACETAVVGAAVGGIPEVVVPGETGELVDLSLTPGTFEPVDRDAFAHGLAEAINRVALDTDLAERYGRNGRKRAEQYFNWSIAAQKTLELYETLVGSG
jgi:glycosyltransferase involved in cell wall biosynthesis